MGYDYESTSIALYRAVFKDNYTTDVSCYLKPDEDLANADEIAPILHPTFEVSAKSGVHKRPPDILPNKETGMYDIQTRAGHLYLIALVFCVEPMEIFSYRMEQIFLRI